MAMVKCTECDRDISSDANSCPSCGKKPKKSVGLGGYIVAGLVLIIIFNLIGKKDDPPTPADPLTPERLTVQREGEIQSARIKNTIRTERIVKDALRDPKSVEWVSAETNEDGSVVCLVYRARNGFGGMNVEQAVMSDWKVSMNSKEAWAKNCSGKKLYLQ